MIYLFVIISGILLFMAYQDFKFRAISWFLFPALFIAIIIRALQYVTFTMLLKNIGLNMLLLIIQFSFVYLYFSLKNKIYLKTFKNVIGLGDILFFIIASFAFSFVNFVIFQIISLSVLLLFFLVRKLMGIKQKKHLPLAGGMSIVLIVFVFLQDIIKIFDFYSNTQYLF